MSQFRLTFFSSDIIPATEYCLLWKDVRLISSRVEILLVILPDQGVKPVKETEFVR